MKAPRFLSRIEILEARIAPALLTTLTWQGDVGTGWDDGTLNTNTNWLSNLGAHKLPVDGSSLTFPDSAANKTNVNDIPNLDLAKLSFTGTGYVITGNAITLSGGISVNVTTSGGSNFQVPITLAADQTFAFSGINGSQFAFGQIVLGGKTLTINNNFDVNSASGANTLTGAGALTKNGTGKLSLLVANDFTGPVQVNAGVFSIGNVGALGAGGDGNGTTVASGATLSIGLGATGTLAEDLTLSGTGAVGQGGALVLANSSLLGVDVNLTGALRLGGDATIDLGNLRKLTLAGDVGAADDALGILTVTSAISGQFAFANTATFTTELAGLTPGAGGHDQLKVIGELNLGSATLNVVPSFTPAVGAKFTIVDNDGVEPIVGTFAGKAEGAAFTAGGVNFTISYLGVDGATGNDVVLTVASLVNPPLAVTLSTDGKSATFIDVDGDLVTVKTTKGPFQQNDFSGLATGVAGGGQLQQINLTTHAADFTGAGLSITAKPGPLGGNGFVNVGYVNATGIDLGAVKIAGDLGRINAGTVGGDVKVAALKSLAVESIGLLGTSTQASGGTLTSSLQGTLAKLAVKGDVRDVDFDFIGAGDGKLGSATIGGSVVATASGQLSITAEAGIGTVKIHGDVRADANIAIRSNAALGAVSIGGSISGSGGVTIAAFGQLPAQASGLDLAIKSLTVAGSVEKFVLTAGLNPNGTSGNADAAIGSIAVGGDWIASSVLAGTFPGMDLRVGTADDSKPPGIDRDQPAIFSSIGSFTVKGQALGTATNTNDMFGIVAERIGKAKVGGRTFAFTKGAIPEAFFAAPTGPGSGAESPVFDFTIRELGSTTPAGTVTGGVNLLVSTDGKTATYTDVDGDFVTVKRSAGAFVAGDFTIAAAANSGGGQLKTLVINDAPGNLSITARPGPDGGNGFVNIGRILAAGVTLGNVRIAGDLGQMFGGTSDPARPGVKSLTVHSIGALGTSTGASDLLTNLTGGVGLLTVLGDVRDAQLAATGGPTGKFGSVVIGGSLIGGASTAFVLAEAGIGSVKIGGSVRGVQINAATAIGSIVIGGDLIGPGGGLASISAFGQFTAPAKGLDLALKSLTVKGSVENARIELGTNGVNANADASLGVLSVGRAWLASSVLAGVKKSADGFDGTPDDTKVAGSTSTRDEARFSTIASITIKGQALGSTASGDSFGIVAEQILKAKIGAVKFVFVKGPDTATTDPDVFAIAPTAPGVLGLPFDFFLREIVV
jgi:autotransporter-associated beta strand protein